jgi:hypothetical protein
MGKAREEMAGFRPQIYAILNVVVFSFAYRRSGSE